jgi:glycolate oxidase FAD binding subunit
VRTVEPATADELAAVLADAARRGARVLVRGGGTKADAASLRSTGALDASPDAADVLVLTRNLNRIVAHRHADLTATVEAGAVLDDVNRQLRQRDQWLPLDPPWADRATIGGIVATNDAGPRRHRYGSPRDLIIGVDLVRVDGVRAKAGGIVVKNVAGYDLARLMAGSFGCLAVIAGVTFKLFPTPPASATVVAALPSNTAIGGVAAALNASQLTPTAVELQMPPRSLLIRFESTPASVDQQAAIAARLVGQCGGRCALISGADEQAAWVAHQNRTWSAGSSGGAADLVAKVTILPTELTKTLDRIEEAARGAAFDLAGRAAVGVLLLRIGGGAADQIRVVRALREQTAEARGAVTLLRACPEVAWEAGVWGPMGDAFGVMQAVKRAFDPGGRLNPGRGPGGL